MTVKNKTSMGHVDSQRRADAKAYVPDISAFMSLCDANYAKFMQLLPDLDKLDSHTFGLSRNHHQLGLITIKLVERAKYTTTFDVSQFADVNLIPSTSLQVRLYHDASMAEVLSYQGISGLRANYVYPNSGMYQKDEKALCNEFLADWLSYCLKFGYSLYDHDFSEDSINQTRSKSFKEENHKDLE